MGVRPLTRAVVSALALGTCWLLPSAGRAAELFGPAPTALAAGENPQHVVVADFDRDGVHDLAVVNRGSDNVSILLGDGLGGFSAAPGSPFRVGEGPFSAAVGDFNADDNPDLAVVSFRDPGVTVGLGNGAGGFGEPDYRPLAGFEFPSHDGAIVAAELTGDGSIDLAVAVRGENRIFLLPGDGRGGFGEPDYRPLDGGPSFLTTADVDDDGDQEIVVAQRTGQSITILNRGDSDVRIPLGYDVISCALADLNADGRLDLVVVNGDEDDESVTVLAQDHAGQWEPIGSVLPTGGGPERVAIGDLDGDENLDLVVNNRSGNSASVFLGNGSLGFSSVAETPVGSGPRTLALADFGGDGLLDLAAALDEADNVRILRGNGLGGFEHRTAGFFVGKSLQFVVVADFNRDTVPDLITGPQPLDGDESADGGIYLGNATGEFSWASDSRGSWCLPNSATGFRRPLGLVADLDSDGIPDLARVGHGTVTLLYGDGLGGVAETATVEPVSAGHPHCVQSGDFDGDAILDLLVIHHTHTLVALSSATVHRGTGPRGGYEQVSEVHVASGQDEGAINEWVVADVNDDGASDLLVGRQAFSGSVNEVSVYLAREGRLLPYVNVPVPIPPNAMAAADLDCDGDLDLAVGALNAATVTILLGDGQGNFDIGAEVAVGDPPETIVVDDFNADQFPDLAALNRRGETVTVLLGDCKGGFTRGGEIATGINPRWLDVGDFDFDGLPDLVVANEGPVLGPFASGDAGTISILSNQLRRRADANGSNRIDGFDVSLLGRLWGRDRGERGYRANADVNLDGTIDGTDLAVVADRFGELDRTVSPLSPSLTASPQANPDTVTLQPGEGGTVGDRLEVDVVVHDTDDAVAGAEFAVIFDATRLRFVGHVPGNYLAGESGVPVVPVNSDRPGRLEVSASRFPANTEVTGDGPAILVSLTFQAIAAGESMLQFSRAGNLVDAAGTAVLDVQFLGGTLVDVAEQAGGPPGERITVTPDELDFGSVDVGDSKRLKLRIANIGFSSLQVIDVTLSSDAGFTSFFTSAFALTPFGFVELAVVFRPEQAGAYSADLTIVNDDRPLTVQLEGTGRTGVACLDPFD